MPHDPRLSSPGSAGRHARRRGVPSSATARNRRSISLRRTGKPTADHGAVSAKPKGLDGKVASAPKGRVADAVKPQSHLTREEVFARIRAKEFTARDLWHSYAAALRDGKDDEAIGFLRRARVVTQDLHAAERAADVPESEVMNFMS